MSSFVDLDDHVVEVADELAERMATDRENVIEIALIALRIRLVRQKIKESAE